MSIQSYTEKTLHLASLNVAKGGIVAFRTDTFYGLGVDPFNRESLHALNVLKGREGKPILVVVSDVSAADRFIEKQNSLFRALAEAHWPGPLTIVTGARPGVPEEITVGTGTVGVRVPCDERVQSLVRVCGGALTATSANPAGAPPAKTAQEVERYFQSSLDLIIDDGPARTQNPSTVIKVNNDAALLIREGVVTKEELRHTLDAIGARLISTPH